MDNKEKLEEAKRLYETANADQKYVLESLFPELAESEDERTINAIKQMYSFIPNKPEYIGTVAWKDILAWLERQSEQNLEWSKEENDKISNIVAWIKDYPRLAKFNEEAFVRANNYAEWLKSLRPQNTWKPSEEMLEALGRAIPENVMEISEDEMLLSKLYQGLKYGRVLSNK